jgi:hypothetical protein
VKPCFQCACCSLVHFDLSGHVAREKPTRIGPPCAIFSNHTFEPKWIRQRSALIIYTRGYNLTARSNSGSANHTRAHDEDPQASAVRGTQALSVASTAATAPLPITRVQVYDSQKRPIDFERDENTKSKLLRAIGGSLSCCVKKEEEEKVIQQPEVKSEAIEVKPEITLLIPERVQTVM